MKKYRLQMVLPNGSVSESIIEADKMIIHESGVAFCIGEHTIAFAGLYYLGTVLEIRNE